MPHSYCLELAGQRLCCSFQFLGTSRYFREYIVDGFCDTEQVCLAREEIEVFRGCNPGMPWNPYAEYKAFLGRIGDELLPKEILMLHCVAFVWHGTAWLLSAPSGTGKTTQFKNLKQLYGDGVQILCGDNPFLRFSHEKVTVYPSPWNGKEELFGAEGAPLAGIICLRRGEEDIVEPVNPRLAVVHVYRSVIHTGQTEEQIKAAAAFTEALLFRVPIWNMFNRDVPGSTKLLYDTVFEEEAFI